jgi:predicted GNAT family N-acyltransferase
MVIIYNFSKKHINQLIQLYKDIGWGEHSIEDIVNCIKGSQLCIGILDKDNNLIGFTRIISDFIYKAFILDVMVNAEYRGSGLGQKLMSTIKNHEKLKKVKHFELYCFPELEPFYSNFGFSADIDGIRLMRCTNS